MTHPLSPAPYTEAEAIADMHACARVMRRPFFVVYNGGFFVGDADDLATYHPNAPIHARSHCAQCVDAMHGDPRNDACINCVGWAGEYPDEAIRIVPIIYINDVPVVAERAA